MQLSAANLLIAAQQLAKQAPQSQPGGPQFASALAEETGGDDGFAPLAFKQTSAPAAARPATPNAVSAIGSALDIRV